MNSALPTIEPAVLAQSRDFCRDITRKKARNFYYGLRLLPEPRRSGMFALYAWMRLTDDIADAEDGRSTQQRSDDLETWRTQTHAAIEGRLPLDEQPHWPAFADTVHQFSIPSLVFDEMIAGQRQDLAGISFETFDDLRAYCYRVAGVVGLASIYVWGFTGGPATEALAIDRGIAFQLTNILRDLREDLSRDRLYLPRAELAAAGLTESDLRQLQPAPAFLPFIRAQIARAESYYEKSAPLDALIDPASRPALSTMTAIYHSLLRKIAGNPTRILKKRISLSPFAKLRLAWRALRG